MNRRRNSITHLRENQPVQKFIRYAALIVPVVLAVVLIVISRPPEDPFRGDAITDPPFTPLTYGIQAFLWWDGGEANLNLDFVRMMMFTHVKQTFAWFDLEPEPGTWLFGESDRILNEAEARGLSIVARLGEVPEWAQGEQGNTGVDVHDTPPRDLNAWANYCGTLATRYRGRIVAYQVWNEPNLSREWGGNPPNAVDYVALLAACSTAIRAADPEAIIISAGLAPTGTNDQRAQPDDVYLQAMYDAGFAQYTDVVGVHAPGFSPPETDPSVPPQGRWASFRRVEDLRKIMVSNGDAARQMAILEVGYTIDPIHPEYGWFAVSEAEQGQYLRGAYEYAAEHWRPWVGLMSAIYLSKPVWNENNEEYWWAVTIPGANPGEVFIRQAFSDLTIMPKYCGDTTVPERDPGAIPSVPNNPCR